MQAIAVLQSTSPTTPIQSLVSSEAQMAVWLYDSDFQGVRISYATLESIDLNKSINCKEKIQIFTMSVFCFNMWYYPLSKIWFSTLEMSLHYIFHTSCPVLVLWMVLQMSTKKNIPMHFHSWFIPLIPESWYITSICKGPLMLVVHGGMLTSKNGATYYTTS